MVFFFRNLSIAVSIVLLAHVSYAGGTLGFGTSLVKTGGATSSFGIPIDLMLDPATPVAALQFSVIASTPSIRLTGGRRGNSVSNAGQWGFGSNVLPGKNGQGDTLIIVLWSQTLQPIAPGLHQGLVQVTYQVQGAQDDPGACTLMLESIVSAGGNGQPTPGMVLTGVTKEMVVQIERAYSFSLDQNYPNPFNPSTHITFSLPASGPVVLTVFNLIGQEVAVLCDGDRAAGTHSVEFDARGLSAGVYLYRLTSPGVTSCRSMLLLR